MKFARFFSFYNLNLTFISFEKGFSLQSGVVKIKKLRVQLLKMHKGFRFCWWRCVCTKLFNGQAWASLFECCASAHNNWIMYSCKLGCFQHCSYWTFYGYAILPHQFTSISLKLLLMYFKVFKLFVALWTIGRRRWKTYNCWCQWCNTISTRIARSCHQISQGWVDFFQVCIHFNILFNVGYMSSKTFYV